MRIWMIDPTIMCRNHLLGEHAEIHIFIGVIDHGQTVRGYFQRGLLEVHSLYTRHQELVKEMKRRGYNHFSVLDEKWKFVDRSGFIDRESNLEELIRRCSKCRKSVEEKSSKS